MHELPRTQNLLEIALQIAQSRRIVNVNLRIGPFSDEREENIRSYWRDLAKGTSGEGAKLHFQRSQPTVRCLACGGAFNIEENETICKYCQMDRRQTAGEEDVKLESIDVE